MDLITLGWDASFAAAFEPFQAQGLLPCRVIEERRDRLVIEGESGPLAATIAGRLRHHADGPTFLPAVGDWVAASVRLEERRATIRALLPRRGALVRKEAGLETRGQILAANLDLVLLVTSMNQEFNPRRIERMLALIWESGARPALLLSKADLCPEPAAILRRAEGVAIGVPARVISSHTGEGVDGIRSLLQRGETAAVIGSSGVGKSTLINRLLDSDRLAVREIRTHDGRGRHATTHRQLFQVPSGGMLVDTPGLREVGLWGEPGCLEGTFPDIEELAGDCRFRDCRHDSEPGCAVRRAIEGGSLDPARYEGFRKLQRELAHLARRQDQLARLAETRRWKRISIASRQRRRQNDRRP